MATKTIFARASPTSPKSCLYFSHTQDFLKALKEGEINAQNLDLLWPPLLRELAKAVIRQKKDNFTYKGDRFEFALNIIPTPGILPAPRACNLPDAFPLPEWLDTSSCRHCQKEILVIKMTRVKEEKIEIFFLTIECGKVYLILLPSLN